MIKTIILTVLFCLTLSANLEVARKNSVALVDISGNSYCTGTIMKGGIILTASHCIRKGEINVFIKMSDKTIVMAKVINRFDYRIFDLAVLKYKPNKGFKGGASFKCMDMNKISNIHIYGFMSNVGVYSKGKYIKSWELKKYFPHPTNPNLNYFLGMVDFGMSGSGIFDDSGNLISVVTVKTISVEAIGGVRNDQLCKWLPILTKVD